MRPASEAFFRAIRSGARMSATAKILTSYQEGVDPTGTDITILGGDVIQDAKADIRSTVDMLTDGTGWVPAVGQTLTPYGNEVFIRRGIVFGNGVVEYVSFGYFRLYDVDQESAPNGPIRIAARDRMSAIVDARLEQPIQFASTDTVGDVFDQLVHEVLPSATIEFDDDTDTETLGRSVLAEEDRFGFLRDLVTSYGKVMYFDYRGILLIASPPDPSASVFDINYGQDGVLINAVRSLSREGVFNAVVARGEGADDLTPAWGVARDMNPESPTYYEGPFLKVPRFYASPLIKTDAQAQSAAASILQQSLGLPYSVDLTALPNPALEVNDPVRVTYSSRERPEVHVLDKITVPLVATAAWTATTREQSLLQIETE